MANKKILLVDDSNTAIMMEKMILRNAAYEVTVAHDGEEGYAKAIADPPHLILLDFVMPRMDGPQTCRRLREHEATRHVPIIMVTTRGEAVHVETGFKNGCNEYLTKPINGAELLAKVRALLGE